MYQESWMLLREIKSRNAMGFLRSLFFAWLFAIITVSSQSYAGTALRALSDIDASALLVLDESGVPLYSKRADEIFIPASTVKILTALIALETWGRAHRFGTEFYIDKSDNSLVVKGLGDPFLVSEEIDLIVDRIKQLDIQVFSRINVDLSYFDDSLNSTHPAKSNNPYDASASALAANFNTIDVEVINGEVKSGEAQTPITPMAKSQAKGLSEGKHRINLGNARRGPQYFAEVLSEKLRRKGVEIQHNQVIESDTQQLDLLFTHYNSRPLEQMVASMLKYSNNFIANQLFLNLGAEKFSLPASFEHSKSMLIAFVDEYFQWQKYVIDDGAGLSRANRLSASQLIEIVQSFVPYRDLMPAQNQVIKAKSGTLNGVSCYAGYVFREGEWLSFALLINHPVEYRFRERLAEELVTTAF